MKGPQSLGQKHIPVFTIPHLQEHTHHTEPCYNKRAVSTLRAVGLGLNMHDKTSQHHISVTVRLCQINKQQHIDLVVISVLVSYKTPGETDAAETTTVF